MSIRRPGPSGGEEGLWEGWGRAVGMLQSHCWDDFLLFKHPLKSSALKMRDRGRKLQKKIGLQRGN